MQLAITGIVATAARIMAEAERIADAAAGPVVNGVIAAVADSATRAPRCMGVTAAGECTALVECTDNTAGADQPGAVTAVAGNMVDTVIAAGPVVAARWDLTIADLVVGGKAARAVASANGVAAGADPVAVGVDRAAGATALTAMGRAALAADPGARSDLLGQDSVATFREVLAVVLGARTASVAVHWAGQDLEGSASAVRNSALSVTAVQVSVATGRAVSPADLGTMIARAARDLAARAPVVAALVTKVSVAATLVARASANGVSRMAAAVNATMAAVAAKTTLDRNSAVRRAASVSVVPVAAVSAPVGQAAGIAMDLLAWVGQAG